MEYRGELYSDEHRRRCKANDVTAQVGRLEGKLVLSVLNVYNLLTSCNPQKVTHTVNTSFLLTKIRVNIQIECSCHIRVTKYDTDCFIITLTFNASGRKCVAEPVKDQMRNI